MASYAAELAGAHIYDTIVISGGTAHHNDLLATNWSEATEAEHFYTVIRKAGLKQEVWLETQATNTGENARLSYQLLLSRNCKPSTILVVTKPYMERRAKATFEKQWPDKSATVRICSAPQTFKTYCNDEQPADEIINIMVGDLERIIKYPELGYQTEQHVPRAVLEALSVLKYEGYTKRSLTK